MSFRDMEFHYISTLEQFIGYKFKDINLLNEALCHSSFVNENSGILKDNERLEFLGDAVLNFVVSDLLIKYYPELHEGNLSRMRANLVNEAQLSSIAKSVQLGDYLHLGKGEVQTDGRNKSSILANALEAIIAAVYLDGGIDASFDIVQDLFRNIIKSAKANTNAIDYKSRLQEKTQVLYHKVPCYVIVGEYGPDHDKLFKVKMTINNIVSYGEGSSKKAAEQIAAKEGLKFLLKCS